MVHMPFPSSLERFLATGNLGDLRLGLPQSEVRRILGEPRDYSERRNTREIWKYDSLQIAFADDLISFLGLYCEDGVLVLPERLIGEVRVVIEDTSVQAIETLLVSKGFRFSIAKEFTFDDQRGLRMEDSGVCIMFAEDHLNSFQLIQAAPAEKNPRSSARTLNAG